MKNKDNPYVVALCDELARKLKEIKIKEVAFLRACYFDTYRNEDVDELNAYIDRNKLSNIKHHKLPDKIGLLLCYFNSKFLKEKKVSDNDVDAAFVFDAEVASRIVSRPLDDNHGCDQTALQSVYSLFGTHRGIIQTHKASCANYRKTVEPYLEGTVRPFLSKWHVPITSQKYNKQEFRHDLRYLQASSMEFLEHFRKTFSI